MTKLTTEEMQRIVDGDERENYARHCEVEGYSINGEYHSPTLAQVTSQNGVEPYYERHNLSDLRTILAQQQEIERLREQLNFRENHIDMALSHNSMSYLLVRPPESKLNGENND